MDEFGASNFPPSAHLFTQKHTKVSRRACRIFVGIKEKTKGASDMATGQLGDIVETLRRKICGRDGGTTDGQLLEAFVQRRDEAAFEALVRRHGPMVWRGCRRLLRHAHDAEDAFQ